MSTIHSLLSRFQKIPHKTLLTFLLIIIAGLSLRLYGYNWDSGGHLHPDERMLVMVTDRLTQPGNMNPDFFNYGTLPISMLAGLSKLVSGSEMMLRMSSYDSLLYLGRWLSVAVDIVTMIFVFLIARALANGTYVFPSEVSDSVEREIRKSRTRSRSISFPLIAMGLYAIAFFPIQNTHFFVVDVYLTCWITMATYCLIRFAQSVRMLWLVAIALLCGAAFATKFTAIVFAVGFGLAVLTILIAKRRSILWILASVMIFGIIFFATHIAAMPYAYRIGELLPHTIPFNAEATTADMIAPRINMINPSFAQSEVVNRILNLVGSIYSRRYIMDTLEQAQMNVNAYVFPYTLQYVGTISYLSYIRNIFWWGWGPALSLLAVWGMGKSIQKLRVTSYQLRQKTNLPLAAHSFQLIRKHIILLALLLVYGVYFAIVGKSAVKFMRYMLPLYPLFAVVAGYGMVKLLEGKRMYRIAGYTLYATALIWTLAFVQIYDQPHTRFAARTWAQDHIPAGSTLAVEHWDDRPIDGSPYTYEEMTLYEQPDGRMKWTILESKLDRTDYIIIASNRLYTPLQYLVDCERFRSCYPIADQYYKNLFAGRPVTSRGTRFEKVAQFTAYPTIKIGPWRWEIKDDSADESFTVYDHPKVMIFKRS